LCELAHVALDPVALERERELRTIVRQPLRDRPSDRTAVCDAEPEPSLAREHHGEATLSAPCASPTSPAPPPASAPRSAASCAHAAGTSSASRGVPRRTQTSTRSATWPTARRSRPPPPECSSATPSSSCS